MTVPKVPKRGFASMSPEQRRAVASRGGKAAQERGVAHRFTSATGRAAGRKGGAAIAKDRKYMAKIGQRGGAAHQENARKARQARRAR